MTTIHEPEARQVLVTDLHHTPGIFDTIVQFVGTDVATGEQVTFGVDHRPAKDLYDALVNDEAPVVDLPEYLVLYVEAPEHPGIVDLSEYLGEDL